jgi:hypothetical protein
VKRSEKTKGKWAEWKWRWIESGRKHLNMSDYQWERLSPDRKGADMEDARVAGKTRRRKSSRNIMRDFLLGSNYWRHCVFQGNGRDAEVGIDAEGDRSGKEGDQERGQNG